MPELGSASERQLRRGVEVTNYRKSLSRSHPLSQTRINFSAAKGRQRFGDVDKLNNSSSFADLDRPRLC